MRTQKQENVKYTLDDYRAISGPCGEMQSLGEPVLLNFLLIRSWITAEAGIQEQRPARRRGTPLLLAGNAETGTHPETKSPRCQQLETR